MSYQRPGSWGDASLLLRPTRKQRWLRQWQNGDGRGVRIGIVDTGVDDRIPELQGAIHSHFAAGLGGRYRRVKKGGDDIGHGTACAWILKSLVPAAELHSIRVIGRSPQEKVERLIVGLRMALDQGWPVINVSLGTPGSRDILEELAEEAKRRGQIIVAAASNDPDRESYPASLPQVIGVDASSLEDRLGFRYREGRSIEVEAHGIYVEAPRPDGSWFHYTGSSFACPHVAAIVARLWEPGIGSVGIREKLAALGSP